MERKLLERMVGAGVLMVALVTVGPMILDGSGSRVSPEGDDIPGQRNDELRTHTFRLNQPTPAKPAPPESRATFPASAPQAAPVVGSSPGPQPAPLGVPPQAKTPRLPPAGVGLAQPVAVPSAPTGSPVASAAASQPEAEAAKRPAGGTWLVQVGTFGQKENADRLVAGLKALGFEAIVSTMARSGKTMYRVRVGPPGTRAQADDLSGRLAAAGHAGQVVPL